MRLDLTRAGDYAVRAMLALAADGTGQPLSSRQMAREWHIPQRFLTQVLRRMAERGLVEPVLGRHGGYRLSRPADTITVLDIVTVVEEAPAKGVCVLRGDSCQTGDSCRVHEMFTAARESFLDVLARRSLADLTSAPRPQPHGGPDGP